MINVKDALFDLGLAHINRWCALNGIAPPKVNRQSGKPDFGVCAYYRSGEIEIWVNSCAALGKAGRAWSWPCYSVDRTPYGVLAHELGHHVDRHHGPAGGTLSHMWRDQDPEPLTSYCPNDNEWFAELFRLFVTNPDLLKTLRPVAYYLFARRWPELAERRTWRDLLDESTRHMNAVENKIRALNKKKPRPTTPAVV